MRILLDKIEIGCPLKFFSKTKNIHIDHEQEWKKNEKKPWHTPSTWAFCTFFVFEKKILMENQLCF